MTAPHQETLWPSRDAICLDCRTVLADGEVCAGGPKHRVRSLKKPRQREELLRAVWGPPGLRQRMKQIAKAGGSGSVMGGLLESCAGCGDIAALEEIGLIIAVIGFVFIIGYLIISFIVRYIQKRRDTLKPRGATAKAARVGRPTGMTGMIEAYPSGSSPISGKKCIGYAAMVTCTPGWFSHRQLMLRDATTLGFTVRLDSGAVVRIPPGRMIVDGIPNNLSEENTTGLDSYLTGLDPLRSKTDDLDPFPQDQIQEVLLRVGDRVEVRGAVTSVIDPDGRTADYRAPAATILQPAATPRLCLISKVTA